ncbi:MAG: LPXTG cell wall anchor domain-containing protein [Rubrobacter sp.]|nr:LPXTG cell wall anchor domain-containing protein [Rubrobacter sp.]
MKKFVSADPGVRHLGGRYVLVLALVAAVALLLAPAALAQTPADDQYGSPLSSEAGVAGDAAGSEEAAPEGSEVTFLPDTGGPLLALAGIAALLTGGTGMLLIRRRSGRG